MYTVESLHNNLSNIFVVNKGDFYAIGLSENSNYLRVVVRRSNGSTYDVNYYGHTIGSVLGAFAYGAYVYVSISKVNGVTNDCAVAKISNTGTVVSFLPINMFSGGDTWTYYTVILKNRYFAFISNAPGSSYTSRIGVYDAAYDRLFSATDVPGKQDIIDMTISDTESPELYVRTGIRSNSSASFTYIWIYRVTLNTSTLTIDFSTSIWNESISGFSVASNAMIIYEEKLYHGYAISNTVSIKTTTQTGVTSTIDTTVLSSNNYLGAHPAFFISGAILYAVIGKKIYPIIGSKLGEPLAFSIIDDKFRTDYRLLTDLADTSGNLFSSGMNAIIDKYLFSPWSYNVTDPYDYTYRQKATSSCLKIIDIANKKCILVPYTNRQIVYITYLPEFPYVYAVDKYTSSSTTCAIYSISLSERKNFQIKNAYIKAKEG